MSESPGLDEKFKDPDNSLRLIFVCAMWMTGFDVPSCSTIYLDKPMRNHTLMQTIARANRVFGNKNNGLIVDYIGVFRDLQKALSIYGSASGGGIEEGDTPVKDKSALVEQLKVAIAEVTEFCTSRGINLLTLENTQDVFQRTKLWDQAVEAILISEDSKRTYFSLVGYVTRLYKAILPDPAANEFFSTQFLLERLADKIRQEIPDADVSDILDKVSDLLDDSITAGEFVISPSNQRIDLSQLDFDQLAAKFSTDYQRTETEKLKGTINRKLQQMVRLNRTRINYLERFQQMIDEYNAGSSNVEGFFRDLIQFAQALKNEDKRAISQRLTEEELAIVDLLTKPDVTLTEPEEKEVKQVAKQLLETLKREKLVLDWRKRQQTKASVEVAIKEILDRLPESYSAEMYQQKCDEVYQHIYESYSGQGRSIYDAG